MTVTGLPAGELDGWDAFVVGHPLATYLQLSGWARVKAANGWTSALVEATGSGGGRIGARILLRRPAPMPWTFAYAPRGPLAARMDRESLAAWSGALRARLGREDGRRVAHIRVDPEFEIGDNPGGVAGAAVVADLRALGWRPAREVQPSVTRIVDLTGDEAALWSGLRSKWRQYVNRARAGGVTVDDVDADADPSAFPTFHRIMAETSSRTRTPIRTEASYREIWDAFAPTGGVRLLFARGGSGEVEGVLMLVRTGTRVVEPYGGMTAAGAASRANYLLKWHAMQTSRERGASSYDMWGLVHPGIRQFKEGFGGREVTFIGAWDLPIRPVGAALYRLGERRLGRRRPGQGGPPSGSGGSGG